MLVVFSDLHFVDGSAGDHNLPVTAYKKALRMVGIDPDNINDTVDYFNSHGVTEIKILFLGDIFDVLRSLNWFERIGSAAPEVRPWGTDEETWNYQNPSIVEKTRGILLQMIPPSARGSYKTPSSSVTDPAAVQKVFDICRLFADLKRDLSHHLSVKYHLVPGNHDRFLHADQQSRQFVIEALSLNDSAAAGFNPLYPDPDYNLLAVHGHEFDPRNFGRPAWKADSFTGDAWAEPSFGEAVTIHVACKLAKYLKEESETHLIWTEELNAAIQNIDNIRPVSVIFDYLKVEQEQRGEIFDHVVDDTIRRVASEFANNRFVQEWSDRLGTRLTDGVVPDALQFAFGMPNLIKFLHLVKWDSLLKQILKDGLGGEQTQKERLKIVAESEYFKYNIAPLLGPQQIGTVKHLVYGHTHVPEVQPLPPKHPAAMLINTGTVRPRIFGYGTPGEHNYKFLQHKTLSFAAFYRAGEKSSAGQQRHYEHFHCVASET